MAAVEQPSEKGDKPGIQGSCSQEQLKKEIKEGKELTRQGGSCSQEKPKRAINKGDKLGRKGGSGSQERPRREIMKGDKLGRQGGNGASTKPGFRKSVTQSFRSKNPYSFQLSGEKEKVEISIESEEKVEISIEK